MTINQVLQKKNRMQTFLLSPQSSQSLWILSSDIWEDPWKSSQKRVFSLVFHSHDPHFQWTMRSTTSFSWELTMTQAGTVTLHLQPRFMPNGCPITWRTEEFLSQELTLREDGVWLEFWSGNQVSGLKGAVIKTQMGCLWSEAISSLIWWCHIYILGKERSINITLNG